MPVGQVKPLELFFSYASEDEALCRTLEKHLKSLAHEGLITTWRNRNISAGQEWEYEIDQHLDSADIILLLISANFIASDYCHSVEMKRALERHEQKEACVIPILLRPTSWQEMPFSKLQCLPMNALPITSWKDEDEGWVQVVNGIRIAIKKIEVPLQKGSSTFHHLWMLPYERNPLFTGREDILIQLYQALMPGNIDNIIQPQAICGLGGIGKTQIAVEYAYRYQNNYESVLWVNANSSETLVSDFLALAHLLRLPEADQKSDPQDIIGGVKRWLQDHGEWLLIFDNADDLMMVRKFFPVKPRGSIILTTRSSITGTIAQRVEVKSMNEKEGALFLLLRAKILDLKSPLVSAARSNRLLASRIVDKMEGLPLALDQAGAYIEETECSLEDYLKLFQTRQNELLKLRGTLVIEHPDAVATTWSLSFEKVRLANPAAADILHLCAFLHPEAIPEEIFIEGASVLGPVLQDIAHEPLLLNDAIRTLLMYSLIHRQTDHMLTIHRLVQAVLKQNMAQEAQRLWSERIIRAIHLAFPEVEYESWRRCQQYVPQVQACLELVAKWNLAFPEAADLLIKAGSYLAESAQYEQAETFYQRALMIREKVLGREHLEVAIILHKLAHLYQDWGKYEEAEKDYQRDLAISEKVQGPDHPRTASSLHCLAHLYQDWGKYEEAERLYQRNLAIREKVQGPEHPDTAATLHSLAGLYQTQGKYEEAEKFYQRALTIREKVQGPEHPQTATTLHNLAHLYQDQGRYGEAEAFHLRELTIREQTLGLQHPQTALSLHCLAHLYQIQGRYEEAERFYQRALTIREKVQGPEHPDTAATLHSLAHLYQDQGKYEEAEAFHLRELTIREQTLGLQHPQTASSLHCLAHLYQDQGKYEEAERFYQRALTIREKVQGPEHPQTATTLHRLAHLYQDQGKYEEAEKHYQRDLAIREKVQGPDHPRTASSLHCLAHLYQDQGKYEEAERFYQRALTIQEKVQGPEHPDTATTLHGLAHLYQDQGKYEEAERFYQRALTIQEKVLGSKHPDTTRILKDYASFLRKIDREEEAMQLDA